jgi:hypothetical protein
MKNKRLFVIIKKKLPERLLKPLKIVASKKRRKKKLLALEKCKRKLLIVNQRLMLYVQREHSKRVSVKHAERKSLKGKNCNAKLMNLKLLANVNSLNVNPQWQIKPKLNVMISFVLLNVKKKKKRKNVKWKKKRRVL